MGGCISISLQSNIDSLGANCCDFISGRARYVYKLEENLDALNTALEELIDEKNDLVRRVSIAEQQQLKRLDKVQRWISRAEAMETEANALILRRSQEIGRLCLCGYCSKSYKSSYEYGKTVCEKLAEVTDLQSKGRFEVVAEREPMAPVIEIPVEPTVGLELLFGEVWRDLSDENVRTIGLYGMGGVGKTTLLKKINNSFLDTPNSKCYVIWVVVSKDHNLEKIQNDIGEKTGYCDDTWKSRNIQQKAEDIYKVLSKKKFVLLLDDIWERIDLGKIGLPLPNRQNGSKVIFTTRSKEVCFEMEADKKVEVMCLSWDKSWELFREKVGEEALNVHPDIPDLAQVVAKECDGLPLALITIGRAMACKRTPQEWRYAIHVLKNSASEFPVMGDEVFPLLKFSYDNLANEKIRSCFLYCALFPEDWEIKRDDLINYWMCEGFLDEHADINGLQGQGYTIIGSLLYACLLEESSEGSNHVKMHDVIRDMALWMARGCGEAGNRVLVNTSALSVEWLKIEKLEVERISLMRNRIQNLAGSPTCPNLLTLLLHGNHLCQISKGFFEFMPKLTVLDLSHNTFLSYLPVEISNLASLQYLNLANTSIKELPRELQKLVMLKYLNLGHLRLLDVIPQEVILSFSRLQVFNVYMCGMSERIVKDSVQCGGNELLVQELQYLKHIITLGVSFKCVTALGRFLDSEMLRNSTQSLCLQYLSTLQNLNLSSLCNMERLEVLTINSCTSLEELKTDCDSERRDQSQSHVSVPLQCSIFPSKELFLSLRYFSIERCPKVKDLTGLMFAPNLVSLSIISCIAVEEIISVDKLGDALEVVKSLEPFLRLENLELITLPKLMNIYSKPLPFQCLKLIEVERCEKLKKLPINSNITRGSNLTIKGERSWWNELEWDDDITKEVFLPCFKAYK